jgi:hypothetical protein
MTQEAVAAAAAADTAGAVADAVAHPDANNWGTNAKGRLETRPVVWTVEPKDGACPLRCAARRARGALWVGPRRAAAGPNSSPPCSCHHPQPTPLCPRPHPPSPPPPPSSYHMDGAVCRRCPQGHVRGAADADCKICLPGTFSDMELHECRPCAPGNYAHWHAMTRCLWCKPGSYADAPSATECKACPAGAASGYQAAKCV